MTALLYPPIRDRHQRCGNCERWSPHSVSVERQPTPDATPDRTLRTVECLACGTTQVSSRAD